MVHKLWWWWEEMTFPQGDAITHAIDRKRIPQPYLSRVNILSLQDMRQSLHGKVLRYTDIRHSRLYSPKHRRTSLQSIGYPFRSEWCTLQSYYRSLLCFDFTSNQTSVSQSSAQFWITHSRATSRARIDMIIQFRSHSSRISRQREMSWQTKQMTNVDFGHT
jgi:hypothetical protein